MDRLDKRKPISSELLPIIEQAIRIAMEVNRVARTIESDDDRVFKKHEPMVKKMIKKLQGTVTRCNLILQQTGNAAIGPGTPKSVSANASCTVSSLPVLIANDAGVTRALVQQAAIEIAKFGVRGT